MRFFFLITLFINLLFANDVTNKFQEKNLTKQQIEFIKKHPVIKVSNEKDWAPYDYNENGIAKGYAIEYLQLISKKTGLHFSFETDKWTNLLKKVENKEIDIIHPLTISKKRKEFLNFSQTFINYDLVLVTSDKNNNIHGLNDLQFKTLAVGKGWTSTKYLKKQYPNITFKEYTNSKDKLLAVAFGEVDAAIESYLTTNYIKQRHLLTNIKTISKIEIPDYSFNLHIGVRKDWPILIDIINKGINSLTNEEILKLNKKFLLVNSKEINFTKNELEYLKEKQKILMCVDPHWMPYESIKDNKHIGMFSDYFKIFKERLPIPIELVTTKSWSQTLEFAKNKKCDIISGAVKTPKRSQYLNFTKPFIKLPLVVATTPNKPFIATIHDILPFKMAIVKNYAYIELLKNKYPDMKIIEVDNRTIGLEKVLAGDVYGFIDSLATVGNQIQNEYFGNVKIAGKLDEEFTIGVATRKDSPILNIIINKAIFSLTPDDHQTIKNKWISVRYDKSFDFTYLWQFLFLLLVVAIFLTYRQYILGKQNKLLLKTKKELQLSVNEFEHLINSTMEAIFILDNGICIDSNKEAIKLLGYENKEELLGLHALDIIDPRHHKILNKNLKKDTVSPYEANAVKKDGTIFPVLIKGHNFIRNNKKIRVTAMLDLTELKQKEKLLSENSKMVALGEMLGNIAHQWRQPLSVISTAASGVKVQKEMDILNNEMLYDSMDGIVNNAQYLSKTIDDFSNFIKEDKVKINFNLNKSINRSLNILDGMFKINDIKIILDSDDTIGIYTFENELTQVFMNIINNAKDILIEKDISEKMIFITSHKHNDNIIISIKDNAGGVQTDIIDRIFEPYFTTKHKTQGTGLGLYMVRKIITESMECEINVQNTDFTYQEINYKGAEFIITL